jgi:hypothetical protein
MSKTNKPKIPDPEVPEKARRRTFTARYKLEILEAAEKAESVGELLRKEGLYSSHLVTWRKQRDEGALSALSRKRGRKPRQDAKTRKIAELERKVGHLERKLRQAETIIEVQKKVSQMLEAAAEEEVI